ncbi:MAG: hypothetical protein D6743_01395 [Calditrichaeota bacterium]|nr:MAG: hypothetical protein D6743_01395 [Calditrichota bacterium]
MWKSRSIAARRPGVVRLLMGCAAGSALIFVFGVAGPYLNLNFVAGKETPLLLALQAGFVVFIPATVLKVVAGAVISARLVAALGASS